MTPRLETLRWWHLEDVAALERELFTSDAWSVETFWAELAATGRHYVVALAGTEVVGYAGLATVGPTADVQTLAVSPRTQGRGIGRLLLTDLLRAAAGACASEVLLEVREDNDPAVNLYRSAGFEQIARRRGYYQPGGYDALIMRLRPLLAP